MKFFCLFLCFALTLIVFPGVLVMLFTELSGEHLNKSIQKELDVLSVIDIVLFILCLIL